MTLEEAQALPPNSYIYVVDTWSDALNARRVENADILNEGLVRVVLSDRRGPRHLRVRIDDSWPGYIEFISDRNRHGYSHDAPRRIALEMCYADVNLAIEAYREACVAIQANLKIRFAQITERLAANMREAEQMAEEYRKSLIPKEPRKPYTRRKKPVRKKKTVAKKREKFVLMR